MELALSALEQELEKLKKVKRCEHCGSDKIYNGPPDCPTCGAPNCCQTCCQLTTTENERDQLRAELETATNLLNNSQESARKIVDENTRLRTRNALLEKLAGAAKREHDGEDLGCKICIALTALDEKGGGESKTRTQEDRDDDKFDEENS